MRTLPRTAGGSTASDTAESYKSKQQQESTMLGNAVCTGRILFILCLATVTALLGYLGFLVLTRAEERLAASQFESIAERALVSAHQITERKRLGTISMASIVSNVLRDTEGWPFVTIAGFEEMANNIIDTSSGRSTSFCPLVKPEELSDFEDFAYDFFENKREPPFPNGTAVSSFGKGIWGVNRSLGASDNRYHDTNPRSSYDSPYEIFSPILQHNAGPTGVLMLNIRYELGRGRVIDSMITCANQRNQTNDNSLECGAISDVVSLASLQNDEPAAMLMQPIFPANARTTIKGFIASSIYWEEVLRDVFNDEVRGIDCVLSTQTTQGTYNVHNGIVDYKGKGDLHQSKYDSSELSITLTPPENWNNDSATYTLTMYPTQEFFDVYSTKNPTITSIGAVCAILLTSALFFLYDLIVRRDIKSKKELLQAKRAFVRFVSHEVRTPLNSVIMGLTLMQEEIATTMGYKSVSKLKKEGSDVSLRKLITEDPNTETASKIELAQFFRLSEEIHDNVLRAVDVLNDLLNYDKIEMGNLKLEFVIIPVQDLVEKTAKEFKVAASQKKIKYSVDFSGVDDDLQVVGKEFDQSMFPCNSTACRTVGDDIRIAQVVRNLLSNAIKFTPAEGRIMLKAKWIKPTLKAKNDFKPREVKFTLKRGEEVTTTPCGVLKVSVVDSGAGMTEHQVKTVFADGVQFNANELQKGNGTGLGLHIAKGIMELHGGDLVAQSEGLGRGTTFSMLLPLYHLPNSEEGGLPEQHPAEADLALEEVEAAPLRILVVDDAAMNRKLLIRLLKNHGHDCVGADDGDVAVEKVRESLAGGNHYDTVLLDHEMPNLSGPEAAQQMRAMGSDVFIVGVTGNLLPDDVAYFKQCGANAVLPKPFKLAALEDLWAEYDVQQRVSGS